ncbi:MAG: biopolymer transporter ExbD [Candidatus Omnitrophica bacterium]|nr:biopolymer transporter ExbD [Candidatus Omnitrophota bacterium]
MEFKGRKKIKDTLNIAPLIDIVFLLLIFFMLSSHFVTQPGLKITLPTAVTAKLHSEEDIIVFITEDNKLILNGKEVVLDKLRAELEIKLVSAKKKTVVIKADEKVDLGLAVKVMDRAKQAKAEGLVISTKVPKDAE